MSRSLVRIRLLAPVLIGAAVLAASCSDPDDVRQPSDQPDGSGPAATVASSGATATVERSPFPGWDNTDFSRTTVPLSEILTGCAGRDCIPPLDVPGAVEIEAPRAGTARFAPARTLDYAAQLPVAVVTVAGVTKGYPLHILTWHEIVNDEFDGTAVVVTYCPLCNTAISFDREVNGRVLDFGVSGKLRNSDLIMWDRQTESWWQQATGEAIVGTLASERLRPFPTTIVSFGDFLLEHPDAPVLTEDTGYGRTYGVNPYEGYDGSSRPFLFSGVIDERLPALSRVVTLDRGGNGVAVPMTVLAELGVANVTVDGASFVVLWAPGATSALDGPSIADSREIGSAAVYSGIVNGVGTQFRPADEPGRFIDEATGSTWNIFGRAVAGPRLGDQLEAVFHTTEFWFAWAAFFPETVIWPSDSTTAAPGTGAARTVTDDSASLGQPVTPAGGEPEQCNAGLFRFPCWQHDESSLIASD